MDSLDRNKRLSVLNNPFLADAVKHSIVANFTQFQGELLLTTGQVADFYDVDDRTIRRLIEDNREEIENSGYRNLREDELKDFRNYVKDKNVLNIKSPVISVFTFRAFLNAGMLLKGSEKDLLKLILDDLLNDGELSDETKIDYVIALSDSDWLNK